MEWGLYTKRAREMDLFSHMAAISNYIVSNSYYGMLRGQIHTNLPPEQVIILLPKRSVHSWKKKRHWRVVNILLPSREMATNSCPRPYYGKKICMQFKNSPHPISTFLIVKLKFKVRSIQMLNWEIPVCRMKCCVTPDIWLLELIKQ